MKTIFLMRHGKAERAAGVSDFDRPLAERGIEDVPRMARAVARHGTIPEIVISSTALRAKQTAELFSKSLGSPVGITFEKSLYGESADSYIQCIRGADDKASALAIVGHNPQIEEASESLACRQEGGLSINMPTSSVVCLEADVTQWKDVRKGRCAILWIANPKILS